MISSKKGVGLAASLLLLSASANATLIDRGNGLIYDDVLNLTWMQDANYASTQGYAHNGAMTWDDAMAWADGLVYQGYDDWRLPTMVDTGNPGCDFALSGTDCGRDVQTTDGDTVYSEMASLWFDTLGNPTQGGVLDTGPFLNLQASDFNDFYWLDQEYALRTDVAWTFYTYTALQFAEQKDALQYAWAVRSGDVGDWDIISSDPSSGETVSVPEPSTAMLLGGGLIGFLGFARRKVSA
ncbi:MAG: PEP-CTERM sorting domain-containing protein [Candidatus Thiodiazotropha sp.]